MKYQLELVWNREFHFVLHGTPHDSIESAISYARAIESMGDGARVKSTRIVDVNGKVVWAYGKMTHAS